MSQQYGWYMDLYLSRKFIYSFDNKLIQKINDTKLTFLKEIKMLFFTLDVVLELVLLRKYINKKAHIYTLTSRCELFLLERVVKSINLNYLYYKAFTHFVDFFNVILM